MLSETHYLRRMRLCRLNPCFSGTCSRRFESVGVARVGNSLNPCFSGTCSRSEQSHHYCNTCVLILVLVEHALGVSFENVFIPEEKVLILVLVEHALGAFEAIRTATDNYRLNPCFSGTCSRSTKADFEGAIAQS